jgi:hypothetical protein
MNVTVEILRWEDGTNLQVLQTLSHRCHSLNTVIATAQSVTDEGVEMYGWPDTLDG